MVLEKDEYRIEGDGIWLSKKALEECRDSMEQMKEFAKHFFKRGMQVSNKAQKGEEV